MEGVFLWLIKQIVFHIQNGCVNITLFSRLSIDEKSFTINKERACVKLLSVALQ